MNTNKFFFLILIAGITFPLFAMEKKHVTPIKKKQPQTKRLKAEKIAALSSLPLEIQFKIIENIILSSHTIQQAVLSIRTLSSSDRYFYDLINNDWVTKQIIKLLAQRFTAGDYIEAAKKLGTKSSLHWISQILPFDLQASIYLLVNTSDYRNAIHTIKDFVTKNEHVLPFFNNPYVIIWVIKIIAKKFNISEIRIAQELDFKGIHNQEVQNWLRQKQYERKIEEDIEYYGAF